MSSTFRLQPSEDRNNVIYRKVRGILNKITPEKFDKLSKELVGLGLNSKIILKGVILLIYEKALEEPKYSSMYAQLCKKLSEEVPNFDNNSSSLDPQNPHANSTFHRLLLFKCRDEFENRFKAAEAFGDGPLSPEDEEQKSLAKHKMLGNIKFICELGKQRLVQETILHSCIHQLCRKKVGEPIQSKVEDLECLCQIMKTIGCLLDTPEAKPLMDQYFDRMEKFSQNSELPSRIRFMLQDVLELRNNKWVPRRIHREQNPKTIIQIRAEAAKDFGYSSPQPNHAGGNQNIYPLSYFNNFTMPLRQSHFGSGPNQVLLGHVQAGQRALDDLYSSPLTPYGLNNPLANANLTGYKFISQQPPNHNLFDTNRGNLNVLHQHQQQQHHHHQQAHQHQHSHHQQSLGVGSSGNNRELPPRFQRMAMHQNNQHHLNPSSKNQIQSNIQINSSLQRAIQGGPISSPVMNPNSLDLRQQVSQNKPFLPTPDHFNSSSDGAEISLRPAQNSIMHKHNMALKNKLQSNMTNNPMINMNSSSNPKIVDPHFPSYQMPNVGKNNKANSEIQANIRNKNQTNKATIIKNTDEALKNYMGGKSEIDILIKGIADLDIPKNFQSEVIVSMIKKTLDGSESDRESVSTIISKMNMDKIFSTNVFLTAFKDLLNVMADLEISIPRVKSHVAGFLARAIVDEIISLKDVYEMVEGGQYYPLLLLCLQNLHQTKGQQWLSENFNQRKVNLMLTLPEIDRVKERLADILRERDLSFLEPLLRIEFDMTKFLSGSDLSPNSLYSWIQSNVDPGLRSTPGFINVLFTCSAKFITERAKQAASDATFNEGDATAGPTNIREHEKDLLSKYAFVFNAFLRDKPNLQLVLLYSLQSYWFGQGCPKEMLLRWFVLLYDLDIVEDEVFFKWKEDINDEYPGKQQALFQVNKWFDWLEKADDDDEEEEEGSDSVSK